MSRISITVKLSFVVALILGAGIFVSLTTLGDTGNSYLAQFVNEPTDDEVGDETSMPIVQEVALSSAGAYSLGGEELYAFRSDKRWPIYSITQLMTALVADRLYLVESPYELIEITEEMIGTEGEAGGFEVGEVIRADDLIKAMMLTGSTDAAAALAMHYGESEFVSLMNQTAGELGMTNTTFRDATGLSLQNLSTAEDIRKLVDIIFKDYTYIWNISLRKSDVIIDRSSGDKGTLNNANSFVATDNLLGGKAGNVSDENSDLVSIFSVPERGGEIVVIVFGASDPLGETVKIIEDLK